MDSHRLFEWQSPQVSETLLSIQDDLNKTVVISKSSSSSINCLMAIPRAPITIGITVNFMFLSFFNSLARSWYLSFFSFSFNFTQLSARTANSTIRQVLFFVDYYFTPWEFFTSALADGFPLEFEWQPVSSGREDSTQYSDWSKQCCSYDCLHRPRCFKLLQSLYQSFGDCTKITDYNWYNGHFHVPQFFVQFPRRVQIFIPLFPFLQFYSVVHRDSKVHNSVSFLFFVDYYEVWSSGRD